MKQIFLIISVISFLLIFSSCEKRIDLDLDEANQKYVIEGIVHDRMGDNFVLISKTKPFNDNTSGLEKISGASVRITDNLNNSYNLYEVEPGYYTDSTLMGVANREYSLLITVDNKTFTAKSYLHPRVEIDSLSQRQTESLFWADKDIPEYRIDCYFTEPSGLGDFYRIKPFVFGEQEDGFIAFNDDYFDGLSTYLPVFESIFYEGDSVTVQLLSVDEQNYRYFNALSLAQDGLVPGNPESNIENEESVGYFGAYGNSEVSIIVVPE